MHGHDKEGLSSLTAALEPGETPVEPGEVPVEQYAVFFPGIPNRQRAPGGANQNVTVLFSQTVRV